MDFDLAESLQGNDLFEDAFLPIQLRIDSK